jgi:hypothetical protein
MPWLRTNIHAVSSLPIILTKSLFVWRRLSPRSLRKKPIKAKEIRVFDRSLWLKSAHCTLWPTIGRYQRLTGLVEDEILC